MQGRLSRNDEACTSGFWVADWVSNGNRGKFPAAFAHPETTDTFSTKPSFPRSKTDRSEATLKGDTKMRDKKLWMVLAQVVVVAFSGVLGFLSYQQLARMPRLLQSQFRRFPQKIPVSNP
jgi:hypothetical protein